MQQLLKAKTLFILLFVIAEVLPVLVLAQDPGPGPDAPVPFDGGLTLVIAAGAGYAIKKARDKRRRIVAENKIVE